MKKMLTVAMALIVACSVAYADKSEQKEINKERQEVLKMSKKELNVKVGKLVKKEAKRLKKEGWQVKPGALPLEKQLERSYLMQYEFNEDQSPKYIMSEASSIGQHYDAAKMQAITLANTNLAGQIQTEVTALIESTVANEQTDPEDAVSVTESVEATKNLISQSLGRQVPVVECFRVLKNKNNEVLVRLAYDSQRVHQTAKNAIKKDLEEKGKKLHGQLDNILGF